MGKKTSSFMSFLSNILTNVHNRVQTLNQSKIFAGIMIIIMNIASKFVTFRVSKTVESYLKFTFSRNVLVFAATWMGTRDIYIAIGMTLMFILVLDVLLNEESRFCCLPESYINHHVSKLEGMENAMPTQEEIVKAKLVLEKAKGTTDTELRDSNQIPIDTQPTAIY